MVVREDPEIRLLLDRAQGGSRSAVGQLLARHRVRLRRMVAVRLDGRLSARVDPSDVVQETLALAAQRFDDYLREPPLPFYPWLRQIALERLIDIHRRHLRTAGRAVWREEFWRPSDSSALEWADQLAASDSGPFRRLVREELAARLQAAMNDLEAADREVLMLRYLEQLSTAETAAVLGISETAVKQRLLRAVRRLRGHRDGAGGESCL